MWRSRGEDVLRGAFRHLILRTGLLTPNAALAGRSAVERRFMQLPWEELGFKIKEGDGEWLVTVTKRGPVLTITPSGEHPELMFRATSGEFWKHLHAVIAEVNPTAAHTEATSGILGWLRAHLLPGHAQPAVTSAYDSRLLQQQQQQQQEQRQQRRESLARNRQRVVARQRDRRVKQAAAARANNPDYFYWIMYQ